MSETDSDGVEEAAMAAYPCEHARLWALSDANETGRRIYNPLGTICGARAAPTACESSGWTVIRS
jgi:hypothetical protein